LRREWRRMRETGNEVAGQVAFDVKSVVLVVFRRMDLASNGKKTILREENGT